MFFSRSSQLVPLSPAAIRWLKVLAFSPFMIGVAIAVYFFSLVGAIAGIAAFVVLSELVSSLVRVINSRTAFAAWSAYCNPGFTGTPKYAMSTAKLPRVLYTREADEDGVLCHEWLLADGAVLDGVVGSVEQSPDGRYQGARCDTRGGSFAVYDPVTHARYHYEDTDAAEVFDRLFRSPGTGGDALAAILGRADRMQLVAWRGLWLCPDELPECSEDVVKKVLGPNLVLSATIIGPLDLRTLEDPYDVADQPVRRLALNGFATPFLCLDLDEAMASADGTSFIVKGIVVSEEFSTIGRRWYYRSAQGGWITLDDEIRDVYGDACGMLGSVAELTATEAVFSLRRHSSGATGGWIQGAARAMPVKVAIASADGAATCRLPLQKFA